MRPELDGRAMLEVLRRHEVRFVLIGGFAAVTHGSPIPTEDVDITPDRSQENLARLSAALRDMGARVRADGVEDGLPFSHDATSLAAVGVWNLVTPFGDFDISFVPTGTRGFGDLDGDAEAMDIGGVPTRVASLADIIRSKQAANRPKDQRVLPVLREILASRYQRKTGSEARPPRG